MKTYSHNSKLSPPSLDRTFTLRPASYRLPFSEKARHRKWLVKEFIDHAGPIVYNERIQIIRKDINREGDVNKNKNEMAKRQAKAKEKAKKKRHVRMTKSPVQLIERPPLIEMGAPKGFITVSISQAIMEYAKPVMDKGASDTKDLNKAMELVSSLWNLAISKQKDDPQEYRRWIDRVKTGAKNILNLEGEERNRFINKMVERQAHLFPEDVQPTPPSMFMYMRKEVSYLIAPFDYGRIKFKVDKEIPPDEEDLRIIGKIEELDRHMVKGSDYDEYEKLALSIEDECPKLFEKWLIAKGLEDAPNEYSSCLDIYITFIYRYMHDDTVLLKSVPDRYFIEFFEDFLLRKVVCEPFEFLYWPPALKLFYQYLAEKGYTKDTAIIGKLDAMEPHFLEILQKRYN